MFQLTVRGPDGSEKIYALQADQGLLVGREDGSDIVLPSTRVSRRHARFYTTGTTLHVEDLGSQSGVFVGGARVTAPSEVRPGLTVEIGEFQIRARRDQPLNAGDYQGTLTGTGTMQGKTLTLPIERGIVGREAPADLIVVDDSVSRKHAEIRRLPDGSFVVRDLHSSNGTMVNNTKIPPDADRPLRPNDKLAIGETNWIVVSAHAGPSADVQRSRTRVIVSVVLIGAVILGLIGFAFMTFRPQITDEGPRRTEVSLHDQCIGEFGNEHFDKAVSICQAAYEQDPIDVEMRKKLRQAQREVKNKAVYDLAMQRTNADELQALDTFFQIEPTSNYFAKGKIEVDRILDRQRPALLATCRDASRKKGSEHLAAAPCTRYLNYTCWLKGPDPAVLGLLKKADAKRAADWACPATLQPWFGVFTATKTPESECPKKYSDKDMAAACVAYAANSVEEALTDLSHVKDVAAKATADQLRDDMNAAVAKLKAGQTQASLQHPQEARSEFDASLVLDSRIMPPPPVESMVGRIARDTVASLFLQTGLDALDKRNVESAYRSCAIAYKYRTNKEGLARCLETAGSQVAALIPKWDCGQLAEASGYAPNDGSNFASQVADAAKDKHCQ